MLNANWSLELTLTNNDGKIIPVRPEPTIEINKYTFKNDGEDDNTHLEQLEVIFSIDEKCIKERLQYFTNLKKIYVSIKIESVNVASVCIRENKFIPIGDGTIENCTCITTTMETHVILQREVHSKVIRTVLFRCNYSDMDCIFQTNFKRIVHVVRDCKTSTD